MNIISRDDCGCITLIVSTLFISKAQSSESQEYPDSCFTSV